VSELTASSNDRQAARKFIHTPSGHRGCRMSSCDREDVGDRGQDTASARACRWVFDAIGSRYDEVFPHKTARWIVTTLKRIGGLFSRWRVGWFRTSVGLANSFVGGRGRQVRGPGGIALMYDPAAPDVAAERQLFLSAKRT
jgi:hypothetical protein